jgi:hypothetical protein
MLNDPPSEMLDVLMLFATFGDVYLKELFFKRFGGGFILFAGMASTSSGRLVFNI